MITRSEFADLEREVIESLEEAFQGAQVNSLDHNYILFLADGEYKAEYLNSSLRLNPFTIDNRIDRYKDESRLNFFIQFMRTFYGFPLGVDQTEDHEFNMTIELMIYTHIWESKPFLKQLKRLAALVDGKSYLWFVEVPEMSKHMFIREEIRNVLKQKRMKLASVISKGFHTSLRNAFAHSEYQIDIRNSLIHLDTYKGGAWDIQNISFNDWSKRFAYTALLSYHFLAMRSVRRKNIIKQFGKSEFLVVHPITSTKFRVRTIFYDPAGDHFLFRRK